VDSVEFSANGKWLLARRDLVATDLTDAETGQPVALLQRPGTVLYNAAFSPDGSLVAVSIGSSIPSGAVTEAGPNLVRRHYVWQTQLCEAGT
jgi:hypothetical protein